MTCRPSPPQAGRPAGSRAFANLQRSAPSSGRFAATFSPAGRRGWSQLWRAPLPSGRGRIVPNCPSQFGWQSG
ncbi:hypothetical protein EN816_25170 [Mesorhizobium sp. M8A.F.Ca.ET.173.01.1.1]|nr:hypothetical protein EOA35_17915 [Mesorhizobium sp. M8A.F.Ca.ET.023.01.1.1]RWC73273.1 MAG: hypothetical protein EOS71_18385 [Mesorhizobium sp.]TGV10935.1 hypothetical protein EN816_25170 [Mesorhizobium sp. M8A.F.Ca.ET.173.01.1.1]